MLHRFTFAFIFILSISFSAYAEYEKVTFPVNKINSLKVENASGIISLYASTLNGIAIEFEKIRFTDTCELDFYNGQKTILVKVTEKRSGFDDESCLVNFRIRVPETFNVNVTNGLGDLKVLGMKARLKYMIGSGNTDLSGDFKEVVGKVGNGKQFLTGYSKKTQLESGRGEFHIDFEKALSKDSLLLKNGTGDATVILPDSSNVKLQLESGLGRVFSEIPVSESKNSFSIKMRSGTGALRVRKN
jgi:hypothetical protein